jgi:hypothetical protein
MQTKSIAALVLLILILSSCDSNHPLIFLGNPELKYLPAGIEIGIIIDNAPPVGFSTLKFDNHIRDRSSGEKTKTYSYLLGVEDQENQLALTRTDYFFPRPDGSVVRQATDVDAGIPGVVSFIQLSTKIQLPDQIQFRKLATGMENIQGRLFPLEKGRECSFDLSLVTQVSHGDKNGPALEVTESYRFKVIGQYDGFALPQREIPGKVFVIEKSWVDPEGNTDNTLIHFSEELGVVLKSVRQVDDGYEEETVLVGIESNQ